MKNKMKKIMTRAWAIVNEFAIAEWQNSKNPKDRRLSKRDVLSIAMKMAWAEHKKEEAGSRKAGSRATKVAASK